MLTVADIARELGFLPVAVPRAPSQTALALLAALPFAPPSVGWAEALSGPAIMDDAKARRELGWAPRYSGLEALRDVVALTRAAGVWRIVHACRYVFATPPANRPYRGRRARTARRHEAN